MAVPKKVMWGGIFAIVLVLVSWLQISLWNPYARDYDIYYLFLDGQRVKKGENPYERVLDGDMVNNDKYTTVFPGFIELSALTQQRRFKIFEYWLALWRWAFLLCNLGIAGLFFWALNALKAPLLGIAAALFWAFNRWTLFVVATSGMDMIPIFFLLISLLLLPRKRWWALAFYGLSLAFKQMGIFLLPLYLIEAYYSVEKGRIRQVLISGLAISVIPLLACLPFMIWNFNGFVNSIFFSATRSPYQFQPPADSLDMRMNLAGFQARIPMLLLMLIVYLAAWKYKLNFYLAVALIMAVFVAFNSILFNQYMPWFIVVLILSWIELYKNRRPVEAVTQKERS